MKKKQKGSALVISLLILLIMTMIGLSAMSSSTMEEKMAAYDRNHKLNFQNAETNIQIAENNVANQKWSTELYKALAEDQAGYFTESDPTVDYFSNASWVVNTNCIGVTTTQNNTSCYTLEVLEGPYQGTSFSLYPRQYGELPPDPGNFISKITLRNTDGTGSVILQSTHKKLALD